MMIQSWQQRQQLTQPEQTGTAHTAVVGSVYADGITLIFPGEDTASAKRYAYNAAVHFVPGQRVHLACESGTYLVEYPIGGGTNADS